MKPITDGKYRWLDENIELLIEARGPLTVWDIRDGLGMVIAPYHRLDMRSGEIKILSKRLIALKKLGRIKRTHRDGRGQWVLAGNEDREQNGSK